MPDTDVRIRAAEAIEHEHQQDQCDHGVFCTCGERWPCPWVAVAAWLRDNAERHRETNDARYNPMLHDLWCGGCDVPWPCPDAEGAIRVAQAVLRGGAE